MTDDDAMDSMDTEEEIFTPRGRRSGNSSVRRIKTLRTLRSHSGSSQHIDRKNTSVRRSTRNRMQTYDNLNTSWILGTQTLKGYPMFQQHGSSSDKELADEVPERKWELRERIPLRSRENHPLTRNSLRHTRERSEHNRPVRELREKSDRDLRDRSDRDLRERPERDLRHRTDRERDLRDRVDRDKDTQSKSEGKIVIDEKETRARKSDSPSRLREGPVTRHCNNLTEKDVKPKEEQNEADEESSRGSIKAENNDNSDNDNDNGFEDMYSRVKRTRRTSQRQLSRNQKIQDEDSDMSESSDTPGPRKYSLRQKKPTVDRFQANVEPVRRSIRAYRSVLTNSMRRKHRSESTSSSDSSDSEPQIYDKKKSKKSRTPAIPQGGCPPNRPPKADISPITLDVNTRFSDVGGLKSHIQCLKEMIIFPMMYSDVFDEFHVTPPKGVLFYGPPGTGKTLIARALANECSQGSRKMTFFMRKGADCLSKWVGESERQLRLLFEQAQQMKPSIIFFDEIDGFAPVRSTKQDQIHSSIVSTLLALMDGLDDRGEVIVIGATNRIDAIDPALRRPGRFDRELFFPLPAKKERLEILKIYVSKWKNPPPDEMLQVLAEKTVGYCGSDLKALCTEAVIQGLRRTYPQIYQSSKRLLLDPKRVQVRKQDFDQASSLLVASSQRVVAYAGKRLQPYTVPLLGPMLEDLLNIIKKIFPQRLNDTLFNDEMIRRPRLLITGNRLAKDQGSTLVQALIYHMEHLPLHILDVSTLFSQSARSPEETCVQVFSEASKCIPSIIYIRSIDQWWPLVPETVKAVFLCSIGAINASTPILILATSESKYEDLPDQIRDLFSELRSGVYAIKKPSEVQRMGFFKPIFFDQCLKPPDPKKEEVEVLEELPVAPDPLPKKLTEKEMKILREKEEVSLRELRIFLREICAKLARNRQFFMFTKPVDTEEVPDYNSIIKQPMDLETMMTKIDMHCYLCARDFLDDIDLICRNALEYNPDRDPADKLIRHRACSLRDNAYALIKAELDSDFEDRCREISANRTKVTKRQSSTNNDCKKGEDELSGVFNDLTKSLNTTEEDKANNDKKETSTSSGGNLAINGRRVSSGKRKRIWARGLVKRTIKKKKIAFDEDVHNPKVINHVPCNLEKINRFESSVMNGHVTSIYDNNNTDSENDFNEVATDKSIGNDKNKNKEKGKDCDKEQDNSADKDKDLTLGKKEGNSCDRNEEKGNAIAESNEEEGVEANELKVESFNEPDLAMNDDCTSKTGEQHVVIDKCELEEVLARTVEETDDFSIDELCDFYVQLSMCVCKYAHTYDRKLLPKNLLKELEFRISRRFKATTSATTSEDSIDEN